MMFSWFAVITAMISCTSSDPVIGGLDVGQIVEGKVLNGDEFPYLVYMEISFKEANGVGYDANCGGILIKPKVVLTAAHCVAVCGKIASILVWAGVSRLELESNFGQRNYGKYYRIHIDYGFDDPKSKTFLYNDIALIWLNKDFELKNGVKLATLPKKLVIIAGNTGWGKTEYQEMSPTLKKIQMAIVPKNTCEKYYAPSGKNFCANSVKKNSGLASGDSGGPFVIEGKVAGIVSHVGIKIKVLPNGTKISQCDTTQPAVFIDIYKYKNWIDSNINDVAKKLFFEAVQSVASNIAKFCNRNRPRHFNGGYLHPDRKWFNATMKIVPPILI